MHRVSLTVPRRLRRLARGEGSSRSKKADVEGYERRLLIYLFSRPASGKPSPLPRLGDYVRPPRPEASSRRFRLGDVQRHRGNRRPRPARAYGTRWPLSPCTGGDHASCGASKHATAYVVGDVDRPRWRYAFGMLSACGGSLPDAMPTAAPAYVTEPA